MNVLEKSGGKIVISKEDAEYFILTYQSLFPEIFQWHDEVRRQVEQTKMLYNCHGHPYTITQPFILESQWKELYAWCPQSTVGEITNIAYAKLQSFIESEKLEWDLLANTHDSYLLQCPIGQEQLAAMKMKEFIEQKFVSPVDGVEFQMRSEAQAGYNWSPAKKDKNQQGLKEIK
jgi:DNA polymerase I-like protein with 3'-5' exonuclease and polymerase domains